MSLQALEAELCQAYRDESAWYTQALQTASNLGALDGPEQVNAALAQVNSHFGHIAQIEARIGAVKDQWRAAGQPPGPALQSALSALETLLRQLQGLFSQSLDQSRQLQANLTPELDMLARQDAMRRAYRAAAGHGTAQSLPS